MITATIGTKTFNVAAVLRSNEILRGGHREVIFLHIPTSEIAYDDLSALLKDSKALAKIVTQNKDENDSEAPVSTAQFDNYIVPGEPVISVSEVYTDPTSISTRTEAFIVKLGKLSYVEEQLQKLGINPLG